MALVLTAKGVQRGEAVAQLSPDQRCAWNEEEILGVKGKPWDWKGGDERFAAAPADAAPRARHMDATVVIAPPVAAGPRDVGFYVTEAAIMDTDVGSTPG